jgi:BirA family biotin operon repressor/biotin-[acetyl-CoA-carboxylase] ligase
VLDPAPAAAPAASASLLSRQERFERVGSTNDVVRDWLRDGVPEVCVVVADEQLAGRGRAGRRWIAPPGRALLLSLGFLPTWLEPERAWRLAATASLAMADAAEEVAGLRDGAVRLKWPNDLVVEVDPDNGAATDGGDARKLAGVLGETEGLGTPDVRAIVGVGVNADWDAREFPAELAGSMTSLRSASGGRPIDLALLLDGFLSRLEVRIDALRRGRFDVADWAGRQLTTGRDVRLELPGGRAEVVRALGVDAATGGLVIADSATPPDGERTVVAGEISHVRLAAGEL